MNAHVRANLWLLALTLLICCVAYPLTLWAIGQVALPRQANGSLIDDGGKPIASRLIAHEVKGDEYFQPRPSAASYNASASGASNFGASNYLLRDRVARTLAPIVKYGSGPRQGAPVADDVVQWFRAEQPQLAATWAKAHPALAQSWVKSEDVTKDFVRDWFKQHPADLDAWKAENAGKDNPEPEDLAVAFFASFAREHPATWLTVQSKDENGKTVKSVVLVGKTDADSADIAAVFFDAWRTAHPDVKLADVPADLVTASASGLDPHITLDNALYQLPRAAAAWAKRTGRDDATVRGEIEALLRRQAAAPMFGLAGVPMVNVVEINHALTKQYAGS